VLFDHRRKGSMRLVEVLENRKEVLKVPEVAKILGISTQQVYKIVAAGTIPHFRVQCAIRFCPAELAEWIKGKIQRSIHPHTSNEQ
jgi:excisionase family DNA binding protein